MTKAMEEARAIAVTQAAREIAAKVYAIYFPWADSHPSATGSKIRRGDWDMNALVQAFANHRAPADTTALAARDAENERLREALEFYADVSKYPAPLTGGMGDLWSDCGQNARRALTAGGQHG